MPAKKNTEREYPQLAKIRLSNPTLRIKSQKYRIKSNPNLSCRINPKICWIIPQKRPNRDLNPNRDSDLPITGQKFIILSLLNTGNEKCRCSRLLNKGHAKSVLNCICIRTTVKNYHCCPNADTTSLITVLDIKANCCGLSTATGWLWPWGRGFGLRGLALAKNLRPKSWRHEHQLVFCLDKFGNIHR